MPSPTVGGDVYKQDTIQWEFGRFFVFFRGAAMASISAPAPDGSTLLSDETLNDESLNREPAPAPDGSTLLSATGDMLRVWRWEPLRDMDAVPVQWTKVSDLCTP